MSGNTGKCWDIFLYEVTDECGGVNPLENRYMRHNEASAFFIGSLRQWKNADRYGLFGLSKKLLILIGSNSGKTLLQNFCVDWKVAGIIKSI